MIILAIARSSIGAIHNGSAAQVLVSVHIREGPIDLSNSYVLATCEDVVRPRQISAPFVLMRSPFLACPILPWLV
jgi:hypothetical protein